MECAMAKYLRSEVIAWIDDYLIGTQQHGFTISPKARDMLRSALEILREPTTEIVDGEARVTYHMAAPGMDSAAHKAALIYAMKKIK
jgi:uncharacterized membrane protein